ncbi:hypothetical protein NHX12_000995 [Muraenolepis orangiensis]|uniref:Uncharacterized protein n=1 Tax=Muraenolepis orangiensis TaxID=630683 RepID=A0A9Q0DZ47_9TELE|nr:hypothetical protein NHX12_000995 [Muraenolepis orangiensis]
MVVHGSSVDEWLVLSSIQPGFRSKLPVSADLSMAAILSVTGMPGTPIHDKHPWCFRTHTHTLINCQCCIGMPTP